MRMTFIIPHKGRDELLEQTILSIYQLEFDVEAIEIIVVTQNTTLDIAPPEQNAAPPTIIFRPQHETVAALRNIGAQHAGGDYLAFVDADMHLSPNWLRVMLGELQFDPKRLFSQRHSGIRTGHREDQRWAPCCWLTSGGAQHIKKHQ